MVYDISDADKEKWDQFVLSNPTSHLYHLYSWRYVLEKSFGLKTFYLLCEQNGVVRGILPLAYQKSFLFGSYLISLPFFNYAGALALDPQAQGELVQEAIHKLSKVKAKYLELRHTANDIAMLPSRTHKVTFVLDLPSSAESLWKSLKDKVRNQVRKAEKEGLQFKEFGPEGVGEFYSLFALNMRNLGSPVITKTFFQNIADTFPDKVRIFTVQLKNRPIAAGYTLGHRTKAEIPWAASDWKYLKQNPNIFLYWNILRRSCELKLAQFDFGRCTRGGGTYHFKQQWGGSEVPLHWFYFLPSTPKNSKEAFKQSLSQRLASKLWKWLPLGIATSLGPRISRHLAV